MALLGQDKKEKFSKFFKNKHIVLPVVIALMCIVVVLFISSISGSSSKTTTQETTQLQSSNTALSYAAEVSSTLQDAINCISGVSNAKVVIVVESSPTSIYLTDTDSAGNTVVVYNKQGSNYSAIEVCQMLPKITGVLVVAKGVTDLAVRYNIINAIAAVYNLNVSCIEILEGK